MDAYFNYFFSQSVIHYKKDANGHAWFYADELANYLGYDKPSHMVRIVDPMYKLTLNNNNLSVSSIGLNLIGPDSGPIRNSDNQQFIMVQESGVYQIALNAKSQRPEIQEFRRWVLQKLLPTVRMFGVYLTLEARQEMINNPYFVHDIPFLSDVNDHRRLYHIVDRAQYPYREFDALQQNAEENVQYVRVGQIVTNNNARVSLNGLAKLLANQMPYHIGANEVTAVLKHERYLLNMPKFYNMPSNKAITEGVLVYVYDEMIDRYVTYVTPKGIDFFSQMFASRPMGALPPEE